MYWRAPSRALDTHTEKTFVQPLPLRKKSAKGSFAVVFLREERLAGPGAYMVRHRNPRPNSRLKGVYVNQQKLVLSSAFQKVWGVWKMQIDKARIKALRI